MIELFAIRHGQTDWNRAGRFQGHIDIGLNDTGRDEARRLAERLRRSGIETIESSDLTRAVETATPLARALGLTLSTDAAWRERSYGIFEGLTVAEITERYPEERAQWLTRDEDFAVAGGESARQFEARILKQVARLAERGGGTRCVVTHGGVLDVLYRHALEIPYVQPRDWSVRNAAVNQLRVANGRIAIVAWDDSEHLDDPLPG